MPGAGKTFLVDRLVEEYGFPPIRVGKIGRSVGEDASNPLSSLVRSYQSKRLPFPREIITPLIAVPVRQALERSSIIIVDGAPRTWDMFRALVDIARNCNLLFVHVDIRGEEARRRMSECVIHRGNRQDDADPEIRELGFAAHQTFIAPLFRRLSDAHQADCMRVRGDDDVAVVAESIVRKFQLI